MKIILITILLISLYFVRYKLSYYTFKESRNPTLPNNILRMDPMHLFFYSLGIVFVYILFVSCLLDPEMVENSADVYMLCLVFIACTIPFVVLFLRYFNWQITLFEDGFAHRNWLRKSKTYKFDSIKFISKINYSAVYQNDKCVVKVPRSAINFKEFIPAAKEYYKQHNIDKKNHIKYIWD